MQKPRTSYQRTRKKTEGDKGEDTAGYEEKTEESEEDDDDEDDEKTTMMMKMTKRQ